MNRLVRIISAIFHATTKGDCSNNSGDDEIFKGLFLPYMTNSNSICPLISEKEFVCNLIIATLAERQYANPNIW